MLAFSENQPDQVRLSSPTPIVVSMLTPSPPFTASPTELLLPSATATLSLTPSTTVISSETAAPSSTACPIPDGWIQYTVQRGETLNPLAARYGLLPQVLADANCLSESQQVVAGLSLFVPGPTALPPIASQVPCTPRYDWVIYIVQPGDTLYNLARRLNTTAYNLRISNCLSTDTIYIGQRLYVPFYPAPYPTSTQPWPATPIPPGTAIPTDTDIPTDIPLPSDTDIPTDTEVPTDTPLPSDTPFPTDTAIPTDTAVPSPTPPIEPPTSPPPSPTEITPAP
jgi:LysM repeat protein